MTKNEKKNNKHGNVNQQNQRDIKISVRNGEKNQHVPVKKILILNLIYCPIIAYLN